MNKQTFKLDNGIVLSNIYDLDGGGSTHYRDFLDIVNKKGKKHYTKMLEWCSGPAFIGYAMLGNKICDHIVLMDKHEPAIVSCNDTATYNNLNDAVTTYCVDAIGKLPLTEKFDLVLGNPPHMWDRDFLHLTIKEECEKNGDTIEEKNIEILERLLLDHNQQIHVEFFKNIGKYLLPNADLFISEPSTSEQMPELFEHVYESGLMCLGEYPMPTMQGIAEYASIFHFRSV